MSTTTVHKLTRQDRDEMFAVWQEPDLRTAVMKLHETVENIIARHVEEATR